MKQISFLLSFLIFQISYSQDTVRLSDVTISSTRFSNSTGSNTIVSLDSVKLMARETPQVLSSLSPGIYSQSDNGTPFGYSYFTLRGMGQNRVQYSINGVPLNEGEDLAVYTSNITDLFSNLSSFNLIRGASISGTGNASFVGGLEMIGKSPFSERSGDFSALYGSFNSYRASVAMTTGEIAPGFGASFRITATGSNGFRYDSYGKSQSAYLTLGYRNGRHVLKFNSFLGNTRNGQSWLPVPEGMNPRTNPLTLGYPVQPDHFLQTIQQLQYSYDLKGLWTLNISPYIVTLNGNYDFALDSVTLGNLALKSINPGGYFNFKYDGPVAKFIIGANGSYYKRNHTFTVRPLINEPIYSNYGAKIDANLYMRASYLLFKWVDLKGDIQWRTVQLNYNNAAENVKFEVYNQSFFNYSIGASVPIKRENYTLAPFVNFAQVTREPTRTDIFGFNDNIDSSTRSTLPGVSPETNKDLEFGVSYVDKIFSIKANGFYMNVKNEILSTNQMNYLGILIRKNVAKSQRVGAELESSYRWKFLYGGVNFAYMKSKVWFDPKTIKVPLLSPEAILYIKQGATYKGFRAEISYNFVSSSFLESSNDTKYKLPALNMLNLSLGYTWKMIDLDLSICNLTNKNQALSGNASFDASGSPSGRNFYYSSGIAAYGSIKVKFL